MEIPISNYDCSQGPGAALGTLFQEERNADPK